MQLYSEFDLLSNSLEQLTDRDTALQQGAAKEIRAHVEAAARELSLVRFANFENELYASIFLNIISGETVTEKFGGILAIRELIDCTSAAAEQKVITFANTLSNALKTNTDYALIELVAVALGDMARNSPVAQVDYVESELNQALDWLRDAQSHSHRRFAACAVLQQLAENAPTVFFVRTKEFFDLIWKPLRDPKEQIRLAAGAALSACLAVLRQRTYHLQWYCNIYEQIHEGFRKSVAESVHGSLLVVEEMLKHTGDFMVPRFKEICKAIIALKEHRSKVVRCALLSLLPSLAQFCPDAFARTYLDESVEIVVRASKVQELRQQALLSTGRLCRAVGPYMASRVDELLSVVIEALTGSGRKKVASEALRCISDMVQGLGAPFHPKVLILLEPMFQSGLTSELIDTLAVVSTSMPNQRVEVQQRLLQEATKILGGDAKPSLPKPTYLYSWSHQGQRFNLDADILNTRQASIYSSKLGRGDQFGREPISRACPSLSDDDSRSDAAARAMSDSVASEETQEKGMFHSIKKGFQFFTKRPSTSQQSNNVSAGIGVAAIGVGVSLNMSGAGAANNMQQSVNAVVSNSPELVLLSLRTLGSVNLAESNLMLLVQQSVLPYLASTDARVRREAAVTCAKIVESMGLQFKSRGPTVEATDAVISRLLDVTVSDSEATVRLSVLRCLSANFDTYLCRAHHIEALQFLLSDENYEIKSQTLRILGRLALANPACVIPPLRLLLMRLISEIKNSSDNRLKQEATQMMCTFMRSMPLQSIIKPFMSVLIRTFPLGTQAAFIDVRLATAGLEAIGELCKVMRQDVLPFAEQLLPVIIWNVHDNRNRRKQEIAIKTLGQLVSATGYVVTPYLQYPQLLPRALDLLFNNSTIPWSLRREVLRTMGLLGALEPHKYGLIVSHLQKHEEQRKAIAGGDRNDGGADEGWRGPKATDGDAGGVISPKPDGKGNELARPSTLAKVNPKQVRSLEEAKMLMGGREASHFTSLMDFNRERGQGHFLDDFINTTELLEDMNVAEKPAHLFMYEQSAMRSLSEPLVRDQPRITPSNEDYYPRVSVTALMRILRDQTQSVHHSSVTQAIMLIFKSLGMQCVPFLDQIVPYLLQLIRHCNPGLRESLLQQLSQLANIVQYHLIPYLPALFEIIQDYWSQHLEHILQLVEDIAVTCSDAFGSYVTTVLPLLLSSLVVPKDVTAETMAVIGKRRAAEAPQSMPSSYVVAAQVALKPLEKTMGCHDALRNTLRPHMHMVVPAFCKLISQLQEIGPESEPWQISAVRVMRRICSGFRGAFVEQTHVVTTRVIHTLTRAVIRAHEQGISPSSMLFSECINCLCRVGRQLGSRLAVFDGLILRSIEGRGINTSSYRELSTQLHNGLLLEFTYADREEMAGSLYRQDDSESDLVGIYNNGHLSGKQGNFNMAQQKMIVNQAQLARSWDVSQRSTAVDWNEWLRRLKGDLLRESPSPALRACSALAQAHAPLAHDLFHAAFVSCWHELNEQYQDSLVRALQAAFRSTTIPPEILQTLLNLAEFMEHVTEPLPISSPVLAELAQKGHAYAKALHYRELEFQTSPASCFESLITINKKLDQYDAAMGVLKVVAQMGTKNPELADAYKVQEAWLAKLGHWDEALEAYELRVEENPRDSAAIVGKLKCLDALGRWEEAIKICNSTLDLLRLDSEGKGGDGTHTTHTKAAVIGARAAWSLNEWDLMDTFVSQLSEDNIDACFMRAVLAVHAEDYEESRKMIDITREHLDNTVSALLTESYGRAYVPLIMVQQCSELEEITEYMMLLREAGMSNTPAASDNSLAPENEATSAGRRASLLSQGMSSYQQKDSDTGDMQAAAPRAVPTRTSHRGSASLLQSLASAPLRADSRTGFVGDSAVPQSSIQHGLQLEVKRRKNLLADKWKKRIRGCCSSGTAAIPMWKYLLNGRRMVLNYQDAFDTWLEFATLCRHGGNNALAEKVLSMSKDLLTDKSKATTADEQNMSTRIRFALLKQDWITPLKKQDCIASLEELIRLNPSGDTATILDCLLKLGEWKVSIVEPGMSIEKSTRRDVLALYGRATMLNPQSYRAWHEWGLSNYRAIEESRGVAIGQHIGQSVGHRESTDSTLAGHSRNARQVVPSLINVPLEVVAPLAVNAAKGLLRAISLGTHRWSSSITQDMLCVLSIWFRFGRIPDVAAALEAGLSTVHLDNWLGVLPQLIARIDHSDPVARGLLHALLVRLGARHSQALVYPLAVALKSPKGDRKAAAEDLMLSLRTHSAKLIDQALMVSSELVRVAILWQEEWHESLEEASRQYFGDGNIVAMLETLAPLHNVLAGGPNTMREMSFVQAYGTDLKDAWTHIQRYLSQMEDRKVSIPTAGAAPGKRSSNRSVSAEDNMLHQAWDLYYSVFKRINAQLPHVTSLELQFCSPALMSARDLDLGVPGTYTVQGQSVRIRHFSPTVAIIRSKQRPRKIRIVGEDGLEYVFLLKGHEDLRQDERAMQLFGLVNALLFHDRRTRESHDLSIQRYAVLPLSPTAGLISWVPDCDTLHDLIRDYRESKKIMLNWEHKLMQQVAPSQTYETLPFAHKLEVFEYALSSTPGDDLAKILWLKSETSEVWLERRATYTRSLAVMSMVGYVLGLGDRHPSNLMLDRKTGKVLHIDFGDCFEVAMQREKYPEKVPFRLTRMLVKAMEVSGIEGNYRRTCEKVMFVLRENRDSLVATLEAFVHDPLISWRLLNTTADKKAVKKGPEGVKATAAATPATTSGDATTAGSDKATTTSITAPVPVVSAEASPRPAKKSELGVNPDFPESPVVTNEAQQGMESGLAAPVTQQIVVVGEPALGDTSPVNAVTTTAGSISSTGSGGMGPTDAVSAVKPDCFIGVPSKPKNKKRASLAPITGEEEEEEEGESGKEKQRNRPDSAAAADSDGEEPLSMDGPPLPSASPKGKTAPAEPTAASTEEPAEQLSPLSHADEISEDSSREAAEEPVILTPLVNAAAAADTATINVSSVLPIEEPAEANTGDLSPLSLDTPRDKKEGSAAAELVVTSPAAFPRSEAEGESKEGAPIPGREEAKDADKEEGNGVSVPVHETDKSEPDALAQSIVNLHERMSLLSVSASLHHGPSHSISRRSIKALVSAQAEVSDAFDGLGLNQQEELTEKAVLVIRRVMDKLTGLDFSSQKGEALLHAQNQIAALDVPEQVDRLILQATANENLCLSYFGWCPFW